MEDFEIIHMEHFENICEKGDLELLKKLHSEGKIFKHDAVRVDKNEPTLFESAGRHGQFKICKWLYYTFQITKEDAMFNDNYLFETTCFYSHLEVCKWLQKKFRFTKEELIPISNGRFFRGICVDSSIEIITYLRNTFGFTMDDTKSFIDQISEKQKEKLSECLTPIGSLTKPAKGYFVNC